MPELKPGYPEGSLDVEQDPYNGTFWMGMMYQAAIAKFDPDQKKFVKLLEIPKALNNIDTQLNMLGLNYKVDGKIWTNDAGNAGHLPRRPQDRRMGDVPALEGAAAQGPILDLRHRCRTRRTISSSPSSCRNYIGRIDAKTVKVTWYQTPSQHTRAAAHGDRQERQALVRRVWRQRHRHVRHQDARNSPEWKLPTPYTAPYYVTFDKNGELWTGGMTTDRVVRLDPKTGKTVEYLMPSDTNIRRVFVDNWTNPVTFWTGANHSATIVRVEPLD